MQRHPLCPHGPQLRNGDDGHQAIAERNLQAILDGAERLLARHESPSISAVAALAQPGRAEGTFRTDLPVDWLVTAAPPGGGRGASGVS